MLQKIPNPVYLFQGIVLRRGAKGTGMKSIELALSMCDIVDIYGFTVDPGYTEWSVQSLQLIYCSSGCFVLSECVRSFASSISFPCIPAKLNPFVMRIII